MKDRRFIFFSLAYMVTLPLAFASCARTEDAPALTSNINACLSPILLSHAAGVASSSVSHYDIFIYEDNEVMSLDSYCRADGGSIYLEAASTSGNKIGVVVANIPDDKFTYNDILSYQTLCDMVQDYAEEDPAHPVMCGSVHFTAGSRQPVMVKLEPLLCRIRIRSLRVSFDERPYKGLKLEDACCYLINVNGRCPVFGTEPSNPSEIINYGAYDPYGSQRCRHPEMLRSEVLAGAQLYCYPSLHGDSSVPGQGTTKLVIEGKVAGVTYYYPVVVGEDCIRRGDAYCYDITITRTGCLDPDAEAVTAAVSVVCTPEDWKEYENETIEY